MKKSFVTVVALGLLVASAVGAVHATNTIRAACIPPAFVQAWS